MYDMLHHYNYTNTLSRFLTGYQQLEDQNEDHENLSGICEDSANEDEPRCRSNSSATCKSFTIAAILGLNNNDNANICNPDVSVMNLTVGGNGRLPGNQHGPMSAHYSVPLHHGLVGKSTGRGGKLNSILQPTKKSCKSKRVRTIFTPEQLERLEAEFERQQYMVGPERLYLAHTLQLTEAQVKVWFQNRRIKWRKHHLELTHQRLAVLKQQQQLMMDETQPDIQDTNSSETEA